MHFTVQTTPMLYTLHCTKTKLLMFLHLSAATLVRPSNCCTELNFCNGNCIWKWASQINPTAPSPQLSAYNILWPTIYCDDYYGQLSIVDSSLFAIYCSQYTSDQYIVNEREGSAHPVLPWRKGKWCVGISNHTDKAHCSMVSNWLVACTSAIQALPRDYEWPFFLF